MPSYRCIHLGPLAGGRTEHIHAGTQCFPDSMDPSCPSALTFLSCQLIVPAPPPPTPTPPPVTPGTSTRSKVVKVVLVVVGVVAVGALIFLLSDARLKRDIRLVRRLQNGIGLYRYRYIGSTRVHIGVLAQEVAGIAPKAVHLGDDGWLRVDYRALDIDPPLNLPDVIRA